VGSRGVGGGRANGEVGQNIVELSKKTVKKTPRTRGVWGGSGKKGTLRRVMVTVKREKPKQLGKSGIRAGKRGGKKRGEVKGQNRQCSLPTREPNSGRQKLKARDTEKKTVKVFFLSGKKTEKSRKWSKNIRAGGQREKPTHWNRQVVTCTKGMVGVTRGGRRPANWSQRTEKYQE